MLRKIIITVLIFLLIISGILGLYFFYLEEGERGEFDEFRNLFPFGQSGDRDLLRDGDGFDREDIYRNTAAPANAPANTPDNQQARKKFNDKVNLLNTQDPFVKTGKEVAHKKVFDPFVDIPGVTDQGSLGGLLNGLFQIGIGIAALLAVLMITFGGFRYMTAVTDKGKSSAKEILTSAVFGLVLVIASVLLLSTINPQIVSLNIAVKPLPEVTYERESGDQPLKDVTGKSLPGGGFNKDAAEFKTVCEEEGSIITRECDDGSDGCGEEKINTKCTAPQEGQEIKLSGNEVLLRETTGHTKEYLELEEKCQGTFKFKRLQKCSSEAVRKECKVYECVE